MARTLREVQTCMISIKQIEEDLQKEEDDAEKQIEVELRKEKEKEDEEKAVLTGKEGLGAAAAEEHIEARNVYNNIQVKSISRVFLKAKQEIERLRQDLKVAEEKLAKLEGCEKYVLLLKDLLEEQQLQLQIYEQPKEQICQRCRLHTAKDAEAEKLMAVENAKQSQAEADEIRKELRNVSDIALEIYRDFDNELELLKMALENVESKKIRACETEVELLHRALGNVESEKIQEFENAKKLQAEADSRTLDRWLHTEMVVQTVERSLKQLHTAVGHALAERMVAIENTKKSQAEMDELRNELEFYLKEVVSIRQELDLRLGVEAEVECLDARIAELQQQLAGCHRKSKEDAELIEVQCVKLEFATAHLRDTDRKLLEMECAMLVCVAEEARLVEELEAGLNREKELEKQITMLRQLTHQPRRQDAALPLAETTK